MKKHNNRYFAKTSEFIKNHRVQILVFLVALLVLFLRRTDAILNAQLWAEDGEQWLQPIVSNPFSLSVLTLAYAGYLAIFARFVPT